MVIMQSLDSFRSHTGKIPEYHLIGQYMTNQKQTEKKLRENEQLYRAVVEQSSDCIFLAEAATRKIIRSNANLEKLLGYSSEELGKLAVYDLIALSKEEIDANIELVSEGHGLNLGERKYRKKSGEIADVEVSVYLLTIENQDIFCVAARDIKERKKVVDALQESEERFKQFSNAAEEGIVVHDDGVIVEVNDAYAGMFGYEAAELTGKSAEHLFTQESWSAIKQNIITGSDTPYEVNGVRKDGSVIHCSNVGKPFKYKGKNLRVAVVRDISEQRKAEAELRYRMEFEQIITSISTSFISLAPDKLDEGINEALKRIGEFSEVDRSYVFMFYENGTMLENTQEWCSEGIDPQIQRLKSIKVEDQLWAIEKIKANQTLHIPRVADLTSDAESLKKELMFENIQSVINVPMVSGGTVIGFLGFDSVKEEKVWSEDIIALLRIIGEIFANTIMHKQTEEALRNSEEKYRILFEDARDAVFISSKEGKFIDINQSAIDLFGYSKNELLGLEINSIYSDSADRAIFQQEIESAGSVKDYEIQLKRKNGEIFDCLITATTRKDAGGRIIGYQGILHDVTELRKTEKAIQDSEAQLNQVINLVPNFIFAKDRQGKYLLVNKALADAYGTTVEELIGRKDADFNPHQDEVDWYLRDDRQVMESGKRKIIPEEKITDSNGNLRFLHTTKIPFTISGSDERAILGVAVDITESKRAQILQDAVYRISQAVDQTKTLSELYEAVHSIVSYVMPAENFYISLYDEIKNEISFPYFVDEVDQPAEPQKPGKGLTEYVLRTGKSLLCTSEIDRELIRKGEVELVGEPAPIWLGVPLIIEQKTIGVMVVQHYTDADAYGEREKHMLEYVSTQVAIAIKRKHSEEALRSSEARFRSIAENIPGSVYDYIYYPDGTRENLYTGPGIEHIIGKTKDETIEGWDRLFSRIHPDDVEGIREAGTCAEKNRTTLDHEYRILAEDGDYRWVRSIGRPTERPDGSFHWQGVLIDVTRRKEAEAEKIQLEEQFRQAQKMEAVGRLAGGIAHDFNNLMTAVLGNCELAMMNLNSLDPLYNRFEEIHKAGDSAAKLTGQLLAFSRSQTLKPKIIDPHEVIINMDNMLRRIIGEDIDLATVAEPDLWKIKVDPGQIEQVLVNLAVNARDAMPNGGKLTIEIANVELDDTYTSTHPGSKPGPHVMLAITDTGSGIKEEIRAHIFEPFFTTKKTGEGTGLGLSMVYGIVKQSGGNIWVYSEIGQGTSFKIYLPKVQGTADEIGDKVVFEQIPAGSESILVVEDDECVREVAIEILEMQGYKVISAKNGTDAIEICERMERQVDLVITDVIMPSMGGVEFIENITQMWPDLKVMFMSGYAPSAVIHREIINKGITFIQKPFNPQHLAIKVREVLDG